MKENHQESIQEKYNFDSVKEHLTTLDKPKDKIRYLIEVKTDYLQNNDGWNIQPVTFDQKCDLEIRKIRLIKRLESKESKEYKD